MLSQVERKWIGNSYLIVSLAPVALIQLATPVVDLAVLLTGAQQLDLL